MIINTILSVPSSCHPLTIARPFNTYGPRQSARAIIPTVITQLAMGKTEIALGNLAPTRDFTFVQDTCAALIALASSEAAIGETVNIGSNTEINMRDLCEQIALLMNKSIVLKQESLRLRPAQSEVQQLRCDNRKLYTLTGYAPGITLQEGLRHTIAWFSEPQHLKQFKAEIYNV